MTDIHLVVQGPHVADSHAAELAAMTSAQRTERIGPQAFRLHSIATRDGAADYCAQAQLDCAFVPADARLDDFRLLVMDMDSTLITIECIDEIADMVGVKPQVAAITESAMRGEIEFKEALRRRVALLDGLDVAALERVYDERLRLSPGADALLARAKALGIRTLLVSGGFTFFTDKLVARLGLDHSRANVLEIVDGKLTGRVVGDVFDGHGKAAALREVRDAMGIAPAQVLALGDGANDLMMMGAAGTSIAYHAKPVVREQATYALNYVGLNGVLALFA